MATAYQEKKDIGTMASNVGHQAQETASEAAKEAKDLASAVSQKVGDAAAYVGKKAEDTVAGLGSGIKSLGETIREHAPSSGIAGSASSAVADTLETSGRYLKEQGLGGIGADLTNLIRRNPIPALLIGVGAGFLLARATRATSRN
jgi:hypothetical protein